MAQIINFKVHSRYEYSAEYYSMWGMKFIKDESESTIRLGDILFFTLYSNYLPASSTEKAS